MRYLAILTLALGVMLFGLATPVTAIELEDRHPNTMLWQACGIGIDSLCTILAADLQAGDPAAGYHLAMILMYRDSSREATERATLLIYDAAVAGYPPALKLWKMASSDVEKLERPRSQHSENPHYLVALRE